MKTMTKLAKRRVKLVQKLDLRGEFSEAMGSYYYLAVKARELDIQCDKDPEIYNQEGWKYAKMCSEAHIYLYNKHVNN